MSKKSPAPANPTIGVTPKPPPPAGLGRHLRSVFLTGLVSLIPLFITLYIVKFLFDLFTTFTQPLAEVLVPPLLRLYAASPPREEKLAYDAYWQLVGQVTQWSSPILALVLMVGLVYALGVLGTFVIGKRILGLFEHFVENLPLVKGIYGTTKQVVSVFRRGGDGQGFQRVVLVEFPRVGIWTVAFVTNTLGDAASKDHFVCCFIPMTPNPTSGFFQIFPAAGVRETDWSVDQGLKLVLSGGLLTPPNVPLPGATPPGQ